MKLDFTRGIHTANEPVNTPEGSYRDAMNMRAPGLSRKTEEGTVKIEGVPDEFLVFGSCALGSETIVVGAGESGSEIGVLGADLSWEIKVPARAQDVFGVTERLQVEGKKNWAGERVVYFCTPNGARRVNIDGEFPISDLDFDKVTSLFLEYDLPRVKFLGEGNTGAVPTGTYQVAARLVTESGASTPFGIVTNPIPIVQASTSLNREAIVGNEPQTDTAKSLSLSIENIDTSFEYIELGVLTYVGLANTPKVTITDQVTINNQETISYTYRGEADDAETSSVTEFIASGVSYTTGKYLTQKDGTLLIGGPVESELPDINWFRVAENIQADFIIKNIPYDENLVFEGSDLDDRDKYSLKETSEHSADGGYGNPITCELYKGYRRNEVYSFTLTPVFKGGVYGPTVHIPGNHSVATEAISNNPLSNPANTVAQADTGGTLGTYISQETYPDDRYPSIAQGQGLRLHKFPSAEDQPLISGDIDNSDMMIRVLGVKFSNIVLDASEIQYASKIAGFIIGKVNRTGNETQLAQGIVRPHTDTQYANDPTFGRGSMLGDGFVAWNSSTVDDTAAHTFKNVGVQDLSSFNFIAPDIIHGLYNYTDGTHMYQHSVFKADPYPSALFNIEIENKTERDGFSTPKTFFKNITGLSRQSIDTTPKELAASKREMPAFGVPLASSAKGGKIETSVLRGSETITMCSSDGFVWMATVDDSDLPYHRDFDTLYLAEEVAGEGTSARQLMNRLHPIGTRVNFVLHSLTRVNTKQYGPLDQMVGMFTHYQEWEGFSGEVEFFNGDTFINKYGLSINDEAAYPFPTDDEADSPAYIGFLKPPNASGIVYTWLESNNNYAYRHYIQPSSFSETSVDGASGSTPFFPAYKQLSNAVSPFGILSMKGENWVRPGYASQYNNQYSAQPTFKPYAVTPPEDIVGEESLINRIAFSSTAVQGEKSDGYQLFLANNYYDVPQEFGELTDIYTKSGELFASTPQTQWRLFFNTLATQATSAGEVVLGTGGAFNRPGVPLMTVDGGFGGTEHWTHATDALLGRLFVDRVHGRIFLFTDQMKEISVDLSESTKEFIKQVDIGAFVLGSEQQFERAMVRCGEQMWSFDLEKKVFISRHNYLPSFMFSHGSRLVSNQDSPFEGDTGLFLHSEGDAGVFYGQLKESSITLVANAGKEQSKHFRTLEVLTDMSTNRGGNSPFTTFTQLEMWNKERYTGKNKITVKGGAFQIPSVLEVLTSRIKDSFRIVVPRDIVENPNSSIFAESNHLQLSTDVEKAKWLAKMRGAYVEIKLTSDNTVGPLILRDVVLGVSENIR